MARKRRKRQGQPAARNERIPLALEYWTDEAATALGGESTGAGVRVTERKALGYPAIWRAVSLISGDVAKLALLVYRTAGEGRAVDKAHPAYPLCRYRANPAGLLSFHLKSLVQSRALVRGNGYAYIDRDSGGRPLGLYYLPTERIEPGVLGGLVYYKYTPDASTGLGATLIPAADVLHIHGLGDDGLQGHDVLSILRESVGSALAARDYGARNFKNSARPGGLIKHPGPKLTPTARTNMRESWERIHKGVDNAHKIAILEEGCDFVPLAASARDAQLLESREFDSREIANIFGVPAHKLGDPSKVAYNSLGEENQSYYNDTLSHWLAQWSAECSDKLLSEAEKKAESHVIDFDYREVHRANLASLTAYATAAKNGNWNSVDEIRALFGDNPLANGQGQWKAPTPAPAPAADPPAPRSTAGLRAVIEDTARRMARRVVGDAGKYRGDPAGFAEWVGSRYHYHAETLRAAFGPAAVLCTETGAGIDAEGLADKLWRTCRQGLIEAGPAHLEAGADALVNHAGVWVADIVTGTKQ